MSNYCCCEVLASLFLQPDAAATIFFAVHFSAATIRGRCFCQPQKTSLRTRTALEIAQCMSEAIISARVRAPHILTVATIRGRHLFHSELQIVRLLFEGSDYSRAATIQG